MAYVLWKGPGRTDDIIRKESLGERPEMQVNMASGDGRTFFRTFYQPPSEKIRNHCWQAISNGPRFSEQAVVEKVIETCRSPDYNFDDVLLHPNGFYSDGHWHPKVSGNLLERVADTFAAEGKNVWIQDSDPLPARELVKV